MDFVNFSAENDIPKISNLSGRLLAYKFFIDITIPSERKSGFDDFDLLEKFLTSMSLSLNMPEQGQQLERMNQCQYGC